MNVVVYYSNTGESEKIARYFSDATGYPMTSLSLLNGIVFKDVILVFPVYCQNLPKAVEELLPRLRAERLALVATYGRMCYGNVLYEAQKLCENSSVVAAAYIPTKHSYLQEKSFEDFEKLAPLIDKIKNDSAAEIKIPRSYKNVFADFAVGWRSRIGVKIWRDDSCIRCGLCEKECTVKGISEGKTNKNCIRCMKCVTDCPVGALHFSNRLPMRLYLKKKKIERVVLYI